MRRRRIKPEMPKFTVKLKYYKKNNKQKVKKVNEEYD
jgi:hypothetical protein